jgi:hypothetical protein
MNVNPGGKVPKMKDTIIPADNPFGKGGETQTLQFDDNLPADHPDKAFEGLPKGMRRILEERGYNTRGLIGQCKTCTQEHARKPHLTETEDDIARAEGDDGNDTEEEEERPFTCCLRRFLENQHDIKNQKSLLEQVRFPPSSIDELTK